MKYTLKRLQEKTVKATTPFYHSSFKELDSFKPKEGLTWLTKNLEYIREVLDPDGDRKIYKVVPKKDLEVFDPRKKEDLLKLKKYIKQKEIPFNPEEVCLEADSLEEIGITNWRSYFGLIAEYFDWQLAESPLILQATKDLGYDGIVSVEDYFENYGIFDTSILEIQGV